MNEQLLERARTHIPVAIKNTQATALPRYFGYGRGVTFYTWTSDQFSQYGNKVIPSTTRDATTCSMAFSMTLITNVVFDLAKNQSRQGLRPLRPL
jgi:hypothetical protein